MAAVNLLPHCSVCKRTLRYGGFDPFLLPCLHTVCSDCMNSACVTLSCCHCRESYCKRDNIFLKDLVTAAEILTSAAKNNPSDIKCTNKTHDIPAEIWCRDCQVFYCKKCEASHSQIKASNSHDKITVKALGTGEPQKLASRCPQHCQYPLDFYDVTCEILICSRCTRSDHKQCECEDIEGASFEDAKEVLKQDQKAVDEHLQKVITSLEEIASAKIEINTRKEVLKKKLTSQFESIRGLINQREKQLDNALNSMDSFAFGECENVTKTLDNLAEKLQGVSEYTQHLSSHSDGGDLLLLKSTVNARVKTCLSEDVPKIDTPSVTISFNKEHVEQITSLLSQFGSVEAEESGSTQCKRISYENVEIEITPESTPEPCGDYIDMNNSEIVTKVEDVGSTSEGSGETEDSDEASESPAETTESDASGQPMKLL